MILNENVNLLRYYLNIIVLINCIITIIVESDYSDRGRVLSVVKIGRNCAHKLAWKFQKSSGGCSSTVILKQDSNFTPNLPETF